MATIISSISFQNFYNYYGSFENNTYNFKEGINIVNADNNMGKSKFYNGILWVLRKMVYDSDLKRMIGENSNPKLDSNYFHKIASGKALIAGRDFDMGVKIVFVENENKYSVKKIVQFKKRNSNWETNEKLEILQTINNRDLPVLDTAEKEKIINKIIPPELINYALLQGESMEELVDLSSQSGLSSTIEALAGIRNLIEMNSLSKDLSLRTKKLFNEKERDINSANKKNTELIQERIMLEGRIDVAKEQIETFKTELAEAKKKREILEAVLLKAKDREKFRGLLMTYDTEIRKLKEEKSEKEKNITSMMFSENSPWVLMGLSEQIRLFDENRQKLISKIAVQNAIDNPIQLPEGSPDVPSLQRMVNKYWCEVCNRPAEKDSEAWKHIKMVLERPRGNKILNKNNFGTFYSTIQTNVGSFSLSIPQIEVKIEKYRNEIDELEDRILQKEEERENAKYELLNAGGSIEVSDVNDRKDISDFTLAEKTVSEKEKNIKEAEKSIKDLNVRLKQIEDGIKSNSSNEVIENYRDFKDMMAVVEQIFVSSKDRVFDKILNHLEINANKKYEELTYGNLSAGGRLAFNKQEDGTVQVAIKNINDGELTGLGTGFQRMKQLSIIMAIISSKIGNNRFDYPFISDAPFSEFGDNFINNFFEIAPKVFTQSIIFIKELYDPKAENYLNDLGKKILDKMANGKIPGTFYVNVIEERADTTNLVTTYKQYK